MYYCTADLGILRGIGRNVLQSPSDGLWHWGRSGQMRSLHHKPIHIISGVGDRVHDTIVSRVAVRPRGDDHVGGIWAGRLLQRSSFLAFDAISSLVTGTTMFELEWLAV